MCVLSMIMDHYTDRWWERTGTLPNTNYPIIIQPQITEEEIAEFKRLLERAREYDKLHNEPNCELEAKKTKLRDLAEQLGVSISFD